MTISAILQTAVSGLTANSQKVAISARNIVNAHTDGYQAQAHTAPRVSGGAPLVAVPLEGLEPSDVNITKEFADMIAARVAYEANAQVIRRVEEMLTDSLDIKA